MKLCSFQIEIRKTKIKKPDGNIFSILKNNITKTEDELENIYKEKNKRQLENICNLDHVIYYFNNGDCECFFTEDSKISNDEGLLNIFLFINTREYESILKNFKSLINKQLQKMHLKIIGSLDSVKIYLVDENGVQNTSERLKSDFTRNKFDLSKITVSVLNGIVFMLYLILFVVSYEKEKKFYENDYFDVFISLSLTVIINIGNIFIRPKQLKFDFKDIWEKIIPSRDIKFEISDDEADLEDIY